ncbi:helix-turn-helix transcriptional regulator [Vibrio genomosp. F10]|uniref:Transcriptional regulator n=1 Tax=Vibrio genomosp. F10 str. ZF-129 TaxID=1187848 RepID=A0A1E5BEF7_9VIBR|nr:metalloregulator ArsR/SmtB family transcription factor [Vibrio genomosp. F10]OEE33159.1 transcriptional regulator [Vibrio genomosp. F10 str. ZF-129]OEE95660.1 transcriptional regulator [Vibrio genomosp. F10 str. 9ZC157]OEF01090.1 transcriptional regulator [Vibrio genomosp. F10 str. 9ZD137]OEF06203.1 transcriptional regulator [Vibrio genomosp. F10 str. 9ZB36]
MKSSEKILQAIKKNGEITAKQLALDLAMTTMGARQHLQLLEDDGLLSYQDLKVKVGRPTRHWSLTNKGHAHFADSHGELSVQMIDSVERVFGLEGLEKIAQDRENQTLVSYQKLINTSQSLEQKLAIIVEQRSNEGYMAEFEKLDDGYLLIENHCPICKAATRNTVLCRSELNVFQALLGKDHQVQRIEHIVQGQRRCAYHISEG